MAFSLHSRALAAVAASVVALLATRFVAAAPSSGGDHSQTAQRTKEAPIAIVHTTVLTMTDDSPLRDATVLIEGGRITAVGPSTTRIPTRARIIEGMGKFLIPGLWDMHVHTAVPAGEPLLPLYIANGITGVRDMGGDLATINGWRRRILGGTLVGPRIVASGPYLQGGDAALPHFVVTTPRQAQAAIDSLAAARAYFVKVHEMIPRDAFFAVARAARARGLRLAGHLQGGITIEEAVDSGQRSVEHMGGLRNVCSAGDSVRLSAASAIHRYTLAECTVAGASAEDATYRHLAHRDVWLTPTLVALEMLAAFPSERLPSDTLAHYLPNALREAMASALEMPNDLPPDAAVLGRALWQKRLAVVNALSKANVRLLAGTDAPLPNSIPGFGMHAELEAMVQAGLSPAQALRAATAEPGRYFATDSIGVIRAGAVADLVLLDADPLEDIRNTRRIAWVVAAGRPYSARDLAALKTRSITAAKGTPR